MLKLDGNPGRNVLCFYSPRKISYEVKIENFNTSLHETAFLIPAQNTTLIRKDFNNKIGKRKFIAFTQKQITMVNPYFTSWISLV